MAVGLPIHLFCILIQREDQGGRRTRRYELSKLQLKDRIFAAPGCARTTENKSITTERLFMFASDLPKLRTFLIRRSLHPHFFAAVFRLSTGLGYSALADSAR